MRKEKMFYKQQKQCAVHGVGTIAESTVCKCFARFESGRLSIPADLQFVDDQIEMLIKMNSGHMTQDIRGTPHVSYECCRVFKNSYMNHYNV